MSYDAYVQFITAAAKFPRWTNIRRRPIESNGGKLLRSIIEEIAETEEAIREYRKDFFLVNYIGREDEIIDYLYTVQVGDIADLDAFVCVDPACTVTDDKALFYTNKDYAYYENGWLVLYKTNDENMLRYMYNDNPYEWPIQEEAIWNIFDEFAWWCGLERFPKERNASLAQRCLWQLYYSQDKTTGRTDEITSRHPNSTQIGLRNAILNAAHAKTDILDHETDNVRERVFVEPLLPEEITFLEPDEITLSRINDDGITLYEEISRFNRDIARTRQWDIDYWDNAFRKLHYLPHVWDAPVEIYKNGVGYRDSLLVSTAKEMGVPDKTDVTVTAYANDKEEIEQYILNNNIHKEIPLTLLKYSNEIKPLPVQYKIIAENLFEVDPKDIHFDFFNHMTGKHDYYLDEFAPYSDNDSIISVADNSLETNKEYTLIFSPQGTSPTTIEIERCRLGNTNLLPDTDTNFQWKNGRFVHKNILLHADTVDELSAPEHLIDNRDGGFTLENPLTTGSFQVSLGDACKTVKQPVIMGVTGGKDTITYNTSYVKQEKYTKVADGYVSPNGTALNSESFVIQPPKSRALYFTLAPVDGETACRIDVYIGNEAAITADNPLGLEYSEERSRSYTIRQETEIPIEFNTLKDVRVVITRTYSRALRILRINRVAFEITLQVNTLPLISYKPSTMLLPKTQEDAVLYCNIKNYTGTAPVVQYVHIGPTLDNITYTVEFNTNGISAPKLDIQSNCRIALYEGKGAGKQLVNDNFDTHLAYRNTDTNKDNILYLDLSQFTKIYDSEPKLIPAVSYGENLYYIVLNKGETKKKISIYGEGYILTSQKTLKELHGITSQSHVFFSRLLKGYILDDVLYHISYDSVALGNRIRIRYTPNGVEDPNATLSCFFNVTDTVSYLTKDYTGRFEQIYIYAHDCQQYIAYNTQNLICAEEDFPIIPSFLPSIPEHTQACYKLEYTGDNDVSVVFENGQNWTTDNGDMIHVTVERFRNPEENPNIFLSEAIVVRPNILLANEISLSGLTDDYGILLPLEEYIVEPPEGMDLQFTEVMNPKIQYAYEDGSTMYIEDDGFNKLALSNIKEILYIKLANGQTVSPSDYTLISKGGIIVWKNENLYGAQIQEIKYIYYKPEALRFKSLADLYDVVGYSVKTMKKLGSYTIKNKKASRTDEIDEDLIIRYVPELVQTAEDISTISRITLSCSKPFFRARQEGKRIVITEVADNTAPVIHNGYYYMNGREYWYFANQYTQTEQRIDGVEIENSKIIQNILLLKQNAINYLKNSKMECNKLDVHCLVDFTYPRNDANQEPLRHIGACDSFAGWQDYNMGRALVQYKNGYAIAFTGRENGYAILDITASIQHHKTISCMFSGELRFWLGQEILIMKERTRKTVFCNRYQPLTVNDTIAWTSLEEIDPEKCRYYLIVEGSGILDEVLIHDSTEKEQIAKWHVKAIDRLGFITEEKEIANTTIDLEYDPAFMTYTGLETDSDGILKTGTTVDWNISQIADFDLKAAATQNFLYRNQIQIAQTNNAVLETKPVAVNYLKSIRSLAFKVNRYIEGNFKNFTIKAYASNSERGTYEEIGTKDNTNLFIFQPKAQWKYYKFRIVAKENQVIEQAELLAIHKETREEALPITYLIEGSAVTKIFNTGISGDYKFKEVLTDTEPNWKAIYIRGAKISTNGEIIWTSWKDISVFPEFQECQLFQFKILLKGKDKSIKINGFRLEVLSHV